MKKDTPLMRQYLSIKENHPDKILLFRMGDFFEMFDKDAEKAAPILNIALTVRNKKTSVQTKMCGVPHHSIAGPIAKLLSSGLNVAICDQVESASASKGLVKRAVTRILSPGMVYDPSTIDQLTANYMAAIDKESVSFLDISTGVSCSYPIKDGEGVFKLFKLLSPAELIVTSSQKEKLLKSPLFQNFQFSVFDKLDFSETLDLEKFSHESESAKRLICYALYMQGEEVLTLLKPFEKKNLNEEMFYSTHFFNHLEVFQNYEGSNKDTLFSSINRTKTPGGARALKQMLLTPLIDQKKIEERWDKIDEWMSKRKELEQVRSLFSSMGDGERKLGKVIHPTCNGRDLLTVSNMLFQGLSLFEFLKDHGCSKEILLAEKIALKIQNQIKETSPVSIKEGGMIQKGVHPQLDEWMELSQNVQASLLKMEQEEKEKTGISSLKIRYNNVFGYYIEVRTIHQSKVPSHYRRKQTLANAERYTTEDLNLLEEKILSARSKQVELEHQIFQELKKEILGTLPSLLSLSYYWSEVDVFSSLAFMAIENNYIRPQFGSDLHVVNSRHPVLEQKDLQEFVPNTLHLKKGETLILTGPNMAGKSTLMRQLALTILLAQSGCFVPAEKAMLPLFRKAFTRIGASDLLSQGLSTFMVEMKETAEILEKADSDSFIILDEIGRGTATFDGMSLAQSILEFLTLEKKGVLLSATHYHELTLLADKHSSIYNGSMAIKEKDNKISFLYTLLKGPASKSYGIQVAKLAGLPSSVTTRASELLSFYEDQKMDFGDNQDQKSFSIGEKNVEKDSKSQKTLDEIMKYSLFEKSPLEAMNQLQKWQKQLKNEESADQDAI